MALSQLKKERRELDERTSKAYSELRNRLCRIIGYVSEHLPEDAEEELYSEHMNLNDDGQEIDSKEVYVLTRKGLAETIKVKHSGETPRMGVETINPIFLLNEKSKPESFDKIVDNLQAIIKKRKIKIPKEYL